MSIDLQDKEKQKMDEMYEYMNKKMDEMRKNNETTITVDFHDFAKMYELVCFMRQIRRIVNGGYGAVKQERDD